MWLHLIKVAQHKAKGNICAKDAAAKEAYKFSSGTGWEIGIISLEFRSIPRPRVIVLLSLSRSSVRKYLKLILYRENHLPDHVFQSLKYNLVIVIVSDASEPPRKCFAPAAGGYFSTLYSGLTKPDHVLFFYHSLRLFFLRLTTVLA